MTRTSQWEPITHTVLWTARINKTYVRKLMQENVATSTSQNQITMNIFSLKRLMGRTHCTVHVWMFCSWRILKSHRVTLGNRVDSFHSLSLEPSIWSTCESKARWLHLKHSVFPEKSLEHLLNNHPIPLELTAITSEHPCYIYHTITY